MCAMRIDAGKSRRGWSYYNDPIQCLMKHRLERELKGLGVVKPTPSPFLIGSLGHTAQAHHHARQGIRKVGSIIVNGVEYDDPDVFLNPIQAVEDQGNAEPEMLEWVDLVKQAYMNYAINPPTIDTPYMVETELVGVVGMKEGNFGFWLVREDAWDLLDEEVSHVPCDDGKTIKVTKLYVDGHKNCNKPVYLSRRLDLATRNEAGIVTIIDHKHQRNIWSKAAMYDADTGFTAIWALGRQKWPGLLRGVDIHAISVTPKTAGKTLVKGLHYSPLADANLPHMILRSAREVARLDMDEANGYIDISGWPMTGAQQVGGACVSIYKNEDGWTCPHFEHCRRGKPLF